MVKRKLKYRISWSPEEYFEVEYARTLDGAKRKALDRLYVTPSNLIAKIEIKKKDGIGYKSHSSYRYRLSRETGRYGIIRLYRSK